ncbi:MAG: hypothetical protein DMF69_04940 [Acidobacteria bacterium]|nr:MAG: hypothetical protein DMF69_04940 [Acidobacteriota bacterium]
MCCANVFSAFHSEGSSRSPLSDQRTNLTFAKRDFYLSNVLGLSGDRTGDANSRQYFLNVYLCSWFFERFLVLLRVFSLRTLT